MSNTNKLEVGYRSLDDLGNIDFDPIGMGLISEIKKLVRERGITFGRELDEFLEVKSKFYNGKLEKRIGLKNLKGKKVEDININ